MNFLKCFISIPLFLIVLLGCHKTDNKPIISTSLAPFATLLSQIVGDTFQVINLTGNFSTAEDIDLSVSTLDKVKKSELYFSFNLPFEQVIKSKNLIPDKQIIHLEKVIDPITFVESTESIISKPEQHKHNNDNHQGHSHSISDIDPHFWTSPKNMHIILEYATQEIIKLNPEYKTEFLNRYNKIADQLIQLDSELKNTIKDRQIKEFMVFHPAYGYLAYQYGLKQLSLEEEGKEVSLKTLDNMRQLVKERKVPVLFLQASFSLDILDSFSKETGIKIIRVNPLDKDYIHQTRLFINGLK